MIAKGNCADLDGATGVGSRRQEREVGPGVSGQGLPVVLVNVVAPAPGRTDAARRSPTMPPDWTELVAELGQHPEDILISKKAFGAFLGTELDARLRERSVTQVFLTGIATSAGVDSTDRSAYDLGYNVVFVVDPITDREAET